MSSPFSPVLNPTPAQVAANTVVANGNRLFYQMVAAYKAAYNLVWNNPVATADLIVAAMGTQAQNIFNRSSTIAAYLVGQGASVPTTTPKDATGNFQWLFTLNADGSMVLATNPAYTPAS